MRDFKLDPRLFLIAGCPLVALGLLSGGALSAAAANGDPAPAIRTLGVIGLVTVVGGLGLLLTIGPKLRVSDADQADDGSARGDDNATEDPVPAELATVVAAADELANTRLPALVQSLTDATETTVSEPFELELPEGPFGELGRLLDDIEQRAHQAIAVQHDTIQARLGDLVVNLVRRNQSLLDRQLESIDQLETSEENPDRLEQLYGLDLLATRMRRNAESLLVLAGSEPPRRRNGPVSAADIVRVAVSEIESYRQVRFAGITDAVVASGAVVDVAHLLSELLENATAFSPPDEHVTVEGRLTGDDYEITVTDRGIGVSPDQADDFNRILAQPPGLGFDMSRSLGFMVVGRLAQRHGIDVVITPASPVGTTATVRLPTSLLVEQATTGEQGDDDTDAGDTEAAALPLAVRTKPGDAPAIANHDGPHPDSADDKSEAATGPGGAASSDALARLLGLPGPTDTDNGADIGADAAVGPTAPEESAPAEADEPSSSKAAAQEQPDTEDGQTSSKAKPTKAKSAAKRWVAAKRKSAAKTKAATERKPPTEPAAEPKPADEVKPAAEANDQVVTDGEPPADDERPSTLADAVPTGSSFDDGIEGLLDANIKIVPRETAGDSGGLKKRDRSKSYAPAREGRQIPEETTAAAAATASSRKPEEIRSMLARYREARHRPVDESNDDATRTNHDENGSES